MKEAVLRRQQDDGIQTLGIFLFEYEDGVKTLGSLELPWKENAVNISCIPKGEYIVKTTYSPTFSRDMWEIMNVPNRKGVRIHAANYFYQIQGCIALGLARGDINLDGEMDMVSSRKAISIAKHYLGNEFKLLII